VESVTTSPGAYQGFLTREAEVSHGVWGSPQRVQGRSLGGGLGDEVPQKLKYFCKYKEILPLHGRTRHHWSCFHLES